MKIIKELKKCKQCNERKEDKEFYDRQTICKKCHNIKTAERKKEKVNPDKLFIG